MRVYEHIRCINLFAWQKELQISAGYQLKN